VILKAALFCLFVTAAYGQQVGYVPHFGHGGGLESTFTFLNLSNTTSRVEVRAFDSAGQPVSLLSLKSPFGPEQAVSAAGVELAGYGVDSAASFSANPNTVADGWLEVKTEGSAVTEVVFSVLDAGGNMVTSTNVNPLQPIQEFSFVAAAKPGSRTGIGLLNPPTNAAAQVTLTLLDRLGNEVGQQTLTVNPGHKIVQFVDELFSGLNNFRGSVEVRSNVGLVPMAIRLDENRHYTTQIIHPSRSRN